MEVGSGSEPGQMVTCARTRLARYLTPGPGRSVVQAVSHFRRNLDLFKIITTYYNPSQPHCQKFAYLNE